MSVEALMNDSKVKEDLRVILEKQEKSGLLGSVGLRTDKHPCTLELKYEMSEQHGNNELCLMAYYKSDSTEVDEESFRLEQIADSINEDIDKVSEKWSEEAQGALENIFGICLLHNGKQIY